MPKRWTNEEPQASPAEDVKKEGTTPEDDTEGHSFILDPETNRAMAREREKEIQRNLRTESRRPFFRRGR